MCGFPHNTLSPYDLAAQNYQRLKGFIKPHNPVSNSTIGKWVKSILDDAGIDVTKFSGNSARPAATSCGTHTGLTLQEILKSGGWSTVQTFATYYNNQFRPILVLPF